MKLIIRHLRIIAKPNGGTLVRIPFPWITRTRS